MHYQIGKEVRLSEKFYSEMLGEKPAMTICDIREDISRTGAAVYRIYISAETSNVTERVLWKKVEGMPVVLEYVINFE